MTEDQAAAYDVGPEAQPTVPHAFMLRLHRVRLMDGESVQVRCPWVPESYECGLIEENDDHNPDECFAYGDGDDGCDEYTSGWRPAKGCALSEVVAGYSLAPDELFCLHADEIAALPRGEWFPVRVRWEGGDPTENRPFLTRVTVIGEPPKVALDA